MKLHETPELFNNAVQATSEYKKIREVYIEKDYWATLVLYTIFHSDFKESAVFKGGTALSKCYNLIDRFSEDVDIVVIQEDGESGNKTSKKIRAISKLVSDILPEKEVEGITSKHGQFRKTAHSFEKMNDGDFGQVREDIILEVSSLGNFNPHSEMEIGSYIAEMMYETGQKDLISEYDLAPFKVEVLGKDRTLCEKIMSLVRFSRSDNPYQDLSNKIRHVYDIHALLNDSETKAFFESEEFSEMLNTVGKDDVLSYKNGNEWLNEHPKTAIVFSDVDTTWEQLKSTYNGIFKDLVTGTLPSDQSMIDTLKKVYERLKKIEWLIKVN